MDVEHIEKDHTLLREVLDTDWSSIRPWTKSTPRRARFPSPTEQDNHLHAEHDLHLDQQDMHHHVEDGLLTMIDDISMSAVA